MKQSEVYKLIEQDYRKNFRPLVTRLSWYMGSIEQAEDVVQEAYTRACSYWAAYDEKQPIEGWIKGILNNSIRDNKRAEIMHGMSDDNSIEKGAEPTAIPKVILKEVVKRIDSKPDNVRRILRLTFLHEHTAKEIANMTGEGFENVRIMVKRFREEVKKEFQWAL